MEHFGVREIYPMMMGWFLHSQSGFIARIGVPLLDMTEVDCFESIRAYSCCCSCSCCCCSVVYEHF
jgi:hypothetical protein